MMTYGDGLADLNIGEVMAFHRSHGKMSTVTAIQPPGRFGAIVMNEKGEVQKFMENPPGDNNWINGGFFVLEPEVLDYIDGPETIWEREPLENLSKSRELVAYQHKGFWRCMDTLRDKRELEAMWNSGKACWKVWEH
jgi:glucose-1-phosphate cytidylyltransferase